MKKTFIKTIAAAVLTVGLTGCVNDLDISSIDPQSSPNADPMGLLAKCYATLGLTGQDGGAGNGDLSDDEGESGFYRTTFNLQELPTDELMWAWQTDTDIPQITMINWNSSSIRVQWAYTRLTYDITLFNNYLTTVADNEENSRNRAEVRFLRALHYWYMLDLFGKSPFKTEFNITELPVEYSGAELYDWLDKELTEIEPLMAEVGEYNNSENFGRADRGAAYMLHARLALNSEVYTKGAVRDYQKAIDYCDLLINSGAYDLARNEKSGNSGYAQLFMADNDRNSEAMQEIILPIRQDGLRTRQYGGSVMLIAGARSSQMPVYGHSLTCPSQLKLPMTGFLRRKWHSLTNSTVQPWLTSSAVQETTVRCFTADVPTACARREPMKSAVSLTDSRLLSGPTSTATIPQAVTRHGPIRTFLCYVSPRLT